MSYQNVKIDIWINESGMILHMYEGDGLDKTGNDKLDHEILRWFNNRMIELVDLYIDMGDDSGWDEDYLMQCFPRNFVEDSGLTQ